MGLSEGEVFRGWDRAHVAHDPVEVRFGFSVVLGMVRPPILIRRGLREGMGDHLSAEEGSCSVLVAAVLSWWMGKSEPRWGELCAVVGVVRPLLGR